MAKFTSKYKELGFYVGGVLKKFDNGVYETDDKGEISVLESLKDVQKAADKAPAKAEDKPKKPAAKK